MQKIQIGRTAVAGFVALFGQFGSAVRIAWIPLVFIVVLPTVGVGLIAYAFVSAMGAQGDVGGTDEAATQAVMKEVAVDVLLRFGWLGVVMGLVVLAAYLMLVNGWLRFLLRGDELGHRIGLLRFGKRELKTLLAGFLLMLLMCSILLLWTAISAIFRPSPQDYGDPSSISVLLPMLVFFISGFVVYFALLRLYVVFPMIALDQGMAWGSAWRLTKGNTWRLFWSFFLAGLLVSVLNTVVLVPTGLVTGVVGTISPENIVFGLVVQLSIYGVVNVAITMIMLGSLAEAYRQLGGPGIGVPEADLAVFDD